MADITLHSHAVTLLPERCKKYLWGSVHLVDFSRVGVTAREEGKLVTMELMYHLFKTTDGRLASVDASQHWHFVRLQGFHPELRFLVLWSLITVRGHFSAASNF